MKNNFNYKFLIMSLLLIVIVSGVVYGYNVQGNFKSFHAEFEDNDGDYGGCSLGTCPDYVPYPFDDDNTFKTYKKDGDCEMIYTIFYSNGITPEDLHFYVDDEGRVAIYKIDHKSLVQDNPNYVYTYFHFNDPNDGCNVFQDTDAGWYIFNDPINIYYEVFYSDVCESHFTNLLDPFFSVGYYINRDPLFNLYNVDHNRDYNLESNGLSFTDEPGFYLMMRGCDDIHGGDYECNIKLDQGYSEDYFWFVGTDIENFDVFDIVDEIFDYDFLTLDMVGDYELDTVADDYEEVCNYLYPNSDAWKGEDYCCNNFGEKTYYDGVDHYYCDHEESNGWVLASSLCEIDVGISNCWEPSIAINDYETTLNGSDGCCGDDVAKYLYCAGDKISTYCIYLHKESSCQEFSEYCEWNIDFCLEKSAHVPNELNCENFNQAQCSVFANINNPLTTNPFCNVITNFIYNDLYYKDQLNQYVCSINNEPDIMELTFEEDEVYEDYEWNWLDAYEESYIIHNLQLPEDKNYNIISNADDWYVCNASGTGEGGSVLGWKENSTDRDKDFILGQYEVLPAEGSKHANCPAGYWYCSCIPEGNGGDDLGMIYQNMPIGCLNPSLNEGDFTTPNDNPYFHENNHRCVLSPYLCNSDLDYNYGEDYDEEDSCFDGVGKKICTDGDELDASTSAYDNTSCPSLVEECGGWLSLNDIPWEIDPEEIEEDEFELKDYCRNSNIDDCFGIPLDNNEICNNSIDDDADGFVDCDDADCFQDEACPTYEQPGIEICDDKDVDSIPIDNDGDDLANCDDPDCESFSGCSTPAYPSVNLFVAPKNESIICYERSGGSLFTQCCDNSGWNCNNGDYEYETLYNHANEFDVKVDSTTTFIGRGVPLYVLNTFDVYDLETGYLDRVRKYTVEAGTSLLLDFEDKKELDFLSFIDYNYYVSLEFDVAYSKISNDFKVEFYYINNTDEQEIFTLNYSNFNNYSNNGDQASRWHHIKIPLPNNIKEYFKLKTYANLGDGLVVLLDNVFLGVEEENNKVYENYMCAGIFGYWIDEFDPAETTNPLSCKNVVDEDDSNCNACDRLNETNDNCNMSELIDNKDNKEWYDFESFKYVCDSYLSFGWTGTSCCGDDSTQTIKEFYNDYNISGCWNSYLIRNNQRVSDAVYYGSPDNNLSRFLFYDGYQFCDAFSDGEIYFDQDELNDYPEKYNISNDITIYDDTSFTIYNHSVCKIQGNYYCQGDGLWENEVLGVDDWKPSMTLSLKDSPLDDASSGCCPKDYCWNGEKCVHPTKYEYNSSKPALTKDFDFNEHLSFAQRNDYSGYRCVFNASGEAEWQESSPKYDVYLNDSGYCKQNNFCFLDERFVLDETARKNLYDNEIIFHNDGCCDKDANGVPFIGETINGVETGIPDCILKGDGEYYNVTDSACKKMHGCVPDGTIIRKNYQHPILTNYFSPYGEYICDNGNWTSKLTMTAKEICNWVDGCDTEKFSLVCDTDLILNHGEDEIKNYINNICIYSNAFNESFMNKGEDVLIVYLLNNSLYEDAENSNFLNVLMYNYKQIDDSLTLNCDIDSQEEFIECDAVGTGAEVRETVYYSKELNAIIVHSFESNNIDFNNIQSETFIDWINNLIYGIFHPGFDFGFF